MLRQRAISAAVLVPPLVVVLVLGGAVDRRGHRRRDRPRRRRDLPPPPVRRLPVQFRCSASCSRSALVLDAAAPHELEGSGLHPRRGRADPRGGRGVHEARPARRPADLVRDGVRGAVRVAPRVRRPAWPGRARRRRPARRSLRSAASAAGSCCSSSASGRYDTGAYFIGRRFGRSAIPHPHLAVEDLCRRWSAGLVACTIAVTAIAAGLGEPSPVGLVLGPLLAARGAGRRPGRIDAQAGGRREGLRNADPGPRRDPGSRRLLPVRRAGRDPVRPRRGPLT